MNPREGGANVAPGDERRARLERYLLGELDEAERQAVREEAIVDPDVFAELREVEIDLLDAAARGTLDAARLERVWEHLLGDARRGGTWATAQALAEAGSGEDRRSQARHRLWWLAGAALAAAASLVLYLGWPRSPESPSAPPSAPAIAQRGPDDVPQTAPPAAEPSASPEPTAEPAPAPPPQEAAGATLVAVYFPAGTLRGEKPTVRVTPAASAVQMTFEIDESAAASAAVSIRAVPGAVVWSAADVPVRVRDGQRSVSVRVPVPLLPSGAYEASLEPAGEQAGIPRVFSFLIRRE